MLEHSVSQAVNQLCNYHLKSDIAARVSALLTLSKQWSQYNLLFYNSSIEVLSKGKNLRRLVSTCIREFKLFTLWWQKQRGSCRTGLQAWISYHLQERWSFHGDQECRTRLVYNNVQLTIGFDKMLYYLDGLSYLFGFGEKKTLKWSFEWLLL